jgi:hypothetical protein
MRVIRKQQLALFLGIAALVALMAAGAAYALTASSFDYSSPKTGYVRVSAMAFAPGESDGSFYNSWSGGLYSSDGICFNAGVDLPVGSRVKAITFYFRSGPATDFSGWFYRRQLPTAESLQLAGIFPSNDAGIPTSVTVTIPAIKQPVTAGRAYGIGMCPGSDGTLYGARVKYTYTSAGS